MEKVCMKKKVSFTIDEDLMMWFRLYSKSEYTTMSSLINQYILNLKRNIDVKKRSYNSSSCQKLFKLEQPK